MDSTLIKFVEKAIKKRQKLYRSPYTSAFRLFNGFSEGVPGVAIDIYGKTAVISLYKNIDITGVKRLLCESLPWLKAILVKNRQSKDTEAKNGVLIFGKQLTKRIQENGVWYGLDLSMNQDSSFYLDTQQLRVWAKEHLKDKTVLNTFAYTGSIGVAALVGGATEVTQLDLSKPFLTVAKRSVSLNQMKAEARFFQTADFWSRISQYKKSGILFDCVILDPPIFSKTKKGTIDLAKNYTQIINKVRPLIANEGYLVVVNNALFQTGKEHYSELEGLCQDGYLNIETTIPVPDSFCGFSDDVSCFPADPSPYNHSTKITVLRVFRKN